MSGELESRFVWKEEKPNSDKSNIPLLLWRGDENNTATVALAFGLYDKEFKELQELHDLLVLVSKDEPHEMSWVGVNVYLALPKDEKLPRQAQVVTFCVHTAMHQEKPFLIHLTVETEQLP